MGMQQTIQQKSGRAAEVVREDLTMFINACFACTGQREFYTSAFSQNVSIAFLHEYILGNYRLLYARTLATGINHFNQAQIVLNLLATGRDTLPAHRAEENALIHTALQGLPAQRAWKLWEQARRQGINNRRTRALARDFLADRRAQSFEAVKYRRRVRAIVRHTHLKLEPELGRFLFQGWKAGGYATPLFESFRRAHYAAEEVYSLPFTVAEGLARKHKIPREQFLTRIQPQMTEHEKLRMQHVADGMPRVEMQVDWRRLPLTRLALYVLSLPLSIRQERYDLLETALEQAAQQTLWYAPMPLGRVAAVLDCSYSASGSAEKRRRPLAVALAAYYLLRAAANEFRACWTREPERPLLAQARGQTNLATPLLDALEWRPDLVVIVSDGYENDPPCGAAELLRVYRTRLDTAGRTTIVHCNPVFAANDFAPRALSPYVPTVGLRDAEDLPTMLGFARFAAGALPLTALETYLSARVARMLTEQPATREKISNKISEELSEEIS
jgi:hypothetical protein